MLKSRYSGCLVGAAVGDALGGPLEFSARRSELCDVVDMKFNPHFELPPGYWTDDTTLTLALALSLIYRSGVHDGLDFMIRALVWQNHGYLSLTGDCFDIGRNCLSAITTFRDRVSPAIRLRSFSFEDVVSNLRNLNDHLLPMTGEEVLTRSLAEQSRLYPKCYGVQPEEIEKLDIDMRCGGNFTTSGALMRIAPIALAYSRNPYQALEMAAEHSKLTHASKESITSCVLYVSMIISALAGSSKSDMLTSPSPDFTGYIDRNASDLSSRVLKLADSSNYRTKRRDEVKVGEDVVDMFEAALWSFANTETYEDGVILAVNLRQDADTVGCIYGGLAGAYYGIENIPKRFLNTLQKKDAIENIANALHDMACQGSVENRM